MKATDPDRKKRRNVSLFKMKKIAGKIFDVAKITKLMFMGILQAAVLPSSELPNRAILLFIKSLFFFFCLSHPQLDRLHKGKKKKRKEKEEVLGLDSVRSRAGSVFIGCRKTQPHKMAAGRHSPGCCLSTCRGDRRECYSEVGGLEEEEEEEGRDIEDVKKTMASTLQHSAFGSKREPRKFFFNINTDNETLNKQERFT